ncbi:MAG: pyridoxamine 5'-phosphate oxidase family protein [Litorilinea sp.]
MAKVLDAIDNDLADWIQRQHLYFVASAPLTGDGMVNCSPKGLDTFTILGPHQVAYLDLTGSGAETIAHVRENGRILIMFCALTGPPRIVRLHGTGRIVTQADAEFDALRARFPQIPGQRAIVIIDVSRVSTSCGFGVPEFSYVGERTQMLDFAQVKGPNGLADYQKKNNGVSLDGLPALADHEIAPG